MWHAQVTTVQLKPMIDSDLSLKSTETLVVVEQFANSFIHKNYEYQLSRKSQKINIFIRIFENI